MIGRLSNSRELESLRKQFHSPALDSISSAPTCSTLISDNDKENSRQAIKSAASGNDLEDCGSFFTGESSLDDIRHNLTLDTSLFNIVRAMMHPDSKLDRCTRTYCSMKLKNSFTGVQLVQWLLAYVKGLHTTKEAKALAQKLLNARLIKCPIISSSRSNSCNFSEHSLYVFMAKSNDHQQYLIEIQEIPEEEEGDMVEQDVSANASSQQGTNGGSSTSQSNGQNGTKKDSGTIQRFGSIRRSGKFASIV